MKLVLVQSGTIALLLVLAAVYLLPAAYFLWPRRLMRNFCAQLCARTLRWSVPQTPELKSFPVLVRIHVDIHILRFVFAACVLCVSVRVFTAVPVACEERSLHLAPCAAEKQVTPCHIPVQYQHLQVVPGRIVYVYMFICQYLVYVRYRPCINAFTT